MPGAGSGKESFAISILEREMPIGMRNPSPIRYRNVGTVSKAGRGPGTAGATRFCHVFVVLCLLRYIIVVLFSFVPLGSDLFLEERIDVNF
jgi:hypothetical protein